MKSHFSTTVALTRTGLEIKQHNMKSETCVFASVLLKFDIRRSRNTEKKALDTQPREKLEGNVRSDATRRTARKVGNG